MIFQEFQRPEGMLSGTFLKETDRQAFVRVVAGSLVIAAQLSKCNATKMETENQIQPPNRICEL